jgi:DNA mismatch repair protein MutS2
LISRGETKKTVRKKSISSNVDLSRKLSEFRQTLDVRGRRASEIHGIVEKFLDDALLFNASELRILHGKGDGVLRQLIQDQLRKHPYVEKAHDEHVDHGGAGITVVLLK